MKDRGPWIKTYSGQRFHFLDPTPDEIHIEDIAHALGAMPRFGGHTSAFYSVAEHSINVSRLAPPILALDGLLHDASEAYLIDIPRPIKHTLDLDGYRRIEAKVQSAIDWKWSVEHRNVKPEDNIMLAHEVWTLMRDPADYEIPRPADLDHPRIWCWLPVEAEKKFLTRFYELRRSH